jgi:hypothetical protein
MRPEDNYHRVAAQKNVKTSPLKDSVVAAIAADARRLLRGALLNMGSRAGTL